jgi:hypothetical protein
MKTIFFIAFVSLTILNFAQSDTLFDIKYHKNGKISTKSVIFQDDIYWGYAKAYNQKGEEIYSMGTRRAGGHGSVDFYYFDNGAVSKAHYTSQPDGGIQWGDVTHYFDEEGNITNIEDNSSDMYGHPRLQITYEPQFEYKENPIKQEVVPCAEIYETEVHVINLSGKSITINVANKGNAENIQQQSIPKSIDTLLVKTYIEAQTFTHPKDFLEFNFLNKHQKKSLKLNTIWADPVQLSGTKRAYYLIVFD